MSFIDKPIAALMPAMPQRVMVLVFGVLILLCLGWAIWLALRRRDQRLLILLGCGVIAAALEGFACYLIQCYHSPVGMYPVYQAFDVYVPLWLAEVYVLFFGAASYVFNSQFARKPSAILFWASFVAVGVCEGAFEVYGIHAGMFLYYGYQPMTIGGFPLHLGFVNPTLALGFACIAQAWFRHVRGPKRYLLIPLTVPALVGLYAAMVMPVAAGLFAVDPDASMRGAVFTILIALSLSLLAYKSLRLLQRST